MNIIRNDTKIKRNAKIGQIALIAGFITTLGTAIILFKFPEQVTLAFGILIVGFLISQVGIYLSNRFGRRPDQQLDQALKGLDSKYTLYHYQAPVSHLLVGPSGVWVLIPYHQGGSIAYSKGRYRQKGGNFYLKLFGQENMGRPDLESQAEVSHLKKYLLKHISEESIPTINVALVFTNPKAEVTDTVSENPLTETVHVNKLKELIRKNVKVKSLSMEKVKLIQDALLESK